MSDRESDMNYVVFNYGVGMVVDRDEWKWWPGLKTTMPDVDVADMHSFFKATNEFCRIHDNPVPLSGGSNE